MTQSKTKTALIHEGELLAEYMDENKLTGYKFAKKLEIDSYKIYNNKKKESLDEELKLKLALHNIYLTEEDRKKYSKFKDPNSNSEYMVENKQLRERNEYLENEVKQLEKDKMELLLKLVRFYEEKFPGMTIGIGPQK